MSVANAMMVLPTQDPVASNGPANPSASMPSFLDQEARRISAGIARGDESAFAALYDAYQGRLYRLALALARGDELLAREAVQSAMLTAAGKLRSIESESHLWNWLARVLRQHLAKTWRQRRGEPHVVELTELPELAATGSDTILEERLEAALLQLRPDDRQIIEWFYFDGLSHKVIAERLETSPKAVSSRIERARSELRFLVKKEKFT